MASKKPTASTSVRRLASAQSRMPTKEMKNRLNRWVSFLLALFVIYIILNLVYVSIVKNDYWSEQANAQQLNSVSIPANRGTIYGKNGEVLAQSATVWTVFIDPNYIKDYESDKIDLIADFLSGKLGVDRQTIVDKIGKNNQYEEIKREVEQEDVQAILAWASENKVKSIYTTEGTKRYYPNGYLAASVIGFTNYDNEGAYGVEAYYDDYLSGTDGKVVSLRDSWGDEMPYRYETLYDAKNGNDVYLTLDPTLQYYVEKALGDAVELHRPEYRACAIMMNVNTGAIYAMATTPGYDLNSPATLYNPNDQAYVDSLPSETEEQQTFKSQEIGRLREQQWKNKAVVELYYPGSTFKTITVSSALEEKLVSLADTFYCSGSYTVADTTFHCSKRSGHGYEDLISAVASSCNPAHINIGLRLGTSTFYKYFKAYGFTEKTGIDLPGEAQSLTITPDTLGQVELGSSSFGQTNKLTAIQVITAVATTINGGYLVTPHVVDKIVDSDGNIIKESSTQIKRQVVSEETSATMRYILESVVNKNGGLNAYIEGYKIGGKSGTSEKQDTYWQTGEMDYVASFVGFAPADDPDIMMLVIVDTPTGGAIYGSTVAAPVVSEVFEQALPYLGHYPEYTEEQLQKALVAAPNVSGMTYQVAKSKLAEKGLDARVIGNGGEVLSQFPSSGTNLPKGSKVLLYTEETPVLTTTVPDVKGMSVSQANAELVSAGLNPYLKGATASSGATAQSQSEAAGTTVLQGAVVEVNFVVIEEIQ